MPTRRRSIVGLVAIGAAGALLAGLAAPERVGSLLQRGQRQVAVAARGIPEPVVVGGTLLIGVAVWLAVMWLLARAAYRIWQRVGGRVKWFVGVVLPDSPLVKFATGVTLFIAVVLVIIGALPALVGSLEGNDEGPAGFTEELSERGLNSDWDDIVDGDTVGGPAACQNSRAGGPDRDGDGLPDAWERAGETPGGAALPGADPGHKDLYVQINHGANVDTLTGTEREQLRSVWAGMPVENPNGSAGIDLHLDDTSPGAGDLDEPVVFSDRNEHARYYTDTQMGDRLCVYHQVTYGHTELDDTVGVGSMPGYASAVEGRRSSTYAGNVSFRVAVTTHELLHNVAGRVDGRPHTSRGWLAGGPDQEFLSEPTARDLNENGLFGPVR